MGSSIENSILSMDTETTKIMKDIRVRIDEMYSKFTDDNKKIPELPKFDEIKGRFKVNYSISKELTDLIDYLLNIKLRVKVALSGIEDMIHIQITSKTDYVLINNFKNNLKRYKDELTGYLFDISDLVKNANNKLKVLQAYNWVVVD